MDGTGTRYASPSGALMIDDGPSFKRKGGCFVSTKAAVFTVILVVALVAITALLTRHFTKEEFKTVTPDAGDSPEPAAEIIRLGNDLAPLHYKLMLYLGVASEGRKPYSLVGLAKILLETKKSSSVIRINGAGLNISEEDVKLIPVENATSDLNSIMDQSAASSLAIKSVKENATSESITVSLERPMDAGKKYILAINYTAPIYREPIGIYSYAYRDRVDNMNATRLIDSNFKPSFARRAFPCFDEPGFKATFDVSVLRQNNMIALSNSKKIKTEAIKGGWSWDHFERTRPMPTYLLAFTVFEFSKRSEFTVDGTDVALWTRRDGSSSRNYTNPPIESYIRYYADRFGQRYELPKLDLVALPHAPQSASGSWGLIKFSESYILDSPTMGFTQLPISRAVVQQWFGNLLTPRWWNDSWVLESASVYFQYAQGYNLKEDVMDYFIANVFQDALMEDSWNCSKALTSGETSTTDIYDYYDEASYKKGASLIHMLSKSFAPPVFDNGIKTFLKKWNKTVETEDFWDSFPAVQNLESPVNGTTERQSVKEIMKSWTSQTGYPVLTVKYDPEKKEIHLEQKKFSTDNSSGANSSHPWHIPLSYISKSDPVENQAKRLWMNSTEKTIQMKEHSNETVNNWFLFHLHSGFYRINYDEKNWHSLMIDFMPDFNNTEYSASKSQIIDDSFELARAGLLDYSVPLNMTRYLSYFHSMDEKNFLPWNTLIEKIRFLELFFWDSPHYALFQNYVKNIIREVYELSKQHYQWSVLDRSVVNLACDYELFDCPRWLKSIYEGWKANGEEIQSVMRDVVYCHTVHTGGKTEIDFFWNRYKSLPLRQNDQTMVLKGLACASPQWAINTLLNETLNMQLPWEDVKELWLIFSKKPAAAATAFSFIKTNWNTITEKFRNESDAVKDILSNYGKTLSTEIHLNELIELKKTVRKGFWRWHLEKAILNVQNNVNWRKAYMPRVIAWLAEHQ